MAVASGAASKEYAGNPKVKALRRSRDNALINAVRIKRTLNRAWKDARRSQTFSKAFESGASSGGVRANPLISKHSFKIASAGASKCLLREYREDASALRVAVLPEPSKSPWVATVTAGAEVMMEQFIAAIVQHGMRNAGVVRECAGRKKASYGDAMKGLEMAVKTTFAGDMGDVCIIPTSVPPVRAKSKKGGKSAKTAKSAGGPNASDAVAWDADADKADE